MVVRACNPSYSGGWGRRTAWTQEAEVVVSRDRVIALQPGYQEWNFVSKTTTTKNKKNKSEDSLISLIQGWDFFLKKKDFWLKANKKLQQLIDKKSENCWYFGLVIVMVNTEDQLDWIVGSSVYLWGCCQRRLTFEWVGWERETHPLSGWAPSNQLPEWL